MDALAILALLVVLAIASARWGCDSRQRPRSREEELAGYGMSWPEPGQARPAQR